MPKHDSSIPAKRPALPPPTRMRASKACDRCRAQKIKCLGQPPCRTCVRVGATCEFNPPSKAAAHLLPDSDLALLQYVRDLELRLRYMEGLLSGRTGLENGTAAASPSVLAPVPPPPLWFRYLKKKWRLHRRPQHLVPHAMAERLRLQLPPEVQSQVSVPRIQLYGWNMLGRHYLNSKLTRPRLDLVEGSQSQLVEYFLTMVNPLFALVHARVVREQYVQYVKEAQLPERTETQTLLFGTMVGLMCALSIRFMETLPEGSALLPGARALDPGVEEELFESCRDTVQQLLYEWVLMELIQLWMLCFIYLRTAARQNLAAMALGLAVSMCNIMSLDYGSNNDARPYDCLKARRIFWCVYTSDRLYLLQNGKYPLMVDDLRIGQQFPVLDAGDDDGWLTIPALAMTHIARIAGVINTVSPTPLTAGEVAAVTADMDRLEKWMELHGMGPSDPFTRQSAIHPLVRLRARIHWLDTRLQLHLRLLLNLVGEPVACPGLSAEDLLRTLMSVLESVQRCADNGYSRTPWFLTLLVLFQAGLVLVVLIHSGIEVSTCHRTLAHAVDLISSLCTPVGSRGTPDMGMAPECLWCLKTLNHLVCLQLGDSIRQLTRVGIDPGPNHVNADRFEQFEKALEPPVVKSPTPLDLPMNDTWNAMVAALQPPPVTLPTTVDDVFAPILWFDQWDTWVDVDETGL